MRSDRPGRSISAYTVGDRVFQLQSGYGYSEESGGLLRIDVHSLDVQGKLGIGSRIEVSTLFQLASLGFDFGDTPLSFFEGDERSNGLSQFNFALRGTILNGKGLIPAIGFEAAYVTAGIPGESFDLNAGRFVLILQNEITDWLSFTGNALYITNDIIQFTANLSGHVNDRVGVFAEYWPIFDAAFETNSIIGLIDSFMNTGIFWQINSDFQVDASCGFSIAQREYLRGDFTPFYIQAGITKRFEL
ncbi:MAG: hypothetical protein AAGC47_01520 [Bacteroidota bacterium]